MPNKRKGLFEVISDAVEAVQDKIEDITNRSENETETVKDTQSAEKTKTAETSKKTKTVESSETAENAETETSNPKKRRGIFDVFRDKKEKQDSSSASKSIPGDGGADDTRAEDIDESCEDDIKVASDDKGEEDYEHHGRGQRKAHHREKLERKLKAIEERLIERKRQIDEKLERRLAEIKRMQDKYKS